MLAPLARGSDIFAIIRQMSPAQVPTLPMLLKSKNELGLMEAVEQTK